MNIAITFRHMDGTDAVKSYAHEKVAKLQKFLRQAMTAQVTLSVEGLEHIAPDRPQLIVSNHVSWFDVFAIAGYLPKRVRFIAKKELGEIPVFGRAWKAAGHISIDRQHLPAAIAALEQAARIMREDNSAVVIFPEGTRGSGEKLLPFKKGGFMMALVTKVEIVPTAVLGSRAILPRDSWRVRGGRITLRFAPPIDTTVYNEDNRNELIARVRGAMEQMLARPLARSSEPEQTRSH